MRKTKLSKMIYQNCHVSWFRVLEMISL